MPEKKIDFAIGGQALIEGVMMRSPSYVTIAVRKQDGTIKTKEEPFISITKRIKFLKLPIIRGMVNVIEMMIVGMRALNFSVEEFTEEEEKEEKEETKKKSKWFDSMSFALSILVSLGLAIFLFKFIPLAITEWLRSVWPALAAPLLFNLIDGLIRIAIFFLYIFILSLSKSFRRVFEYHGAEHMAVHTYEHNEPLDVEHIKKFPPEHPRCGTSFIMFVLIISIIILSFVPRHPVFWINLLRRLAVIPFIAGVSYELLKWTAKFRSHGLVKLLTYPGILTQYITTKKPDEKQIEIAKTALEKALELEKTMPPPS